jgi:hypothetical protein
MRLVFARVDSPSSGSRFSKYLNDTFGQPKPREVAVPFGWILAASACVVAFGIYRTALASRMVSGSEEHATRMRGPDRSRGAGGDDRSSN